MRKILLYFMLVMILVFGSTSSIQAKSIRNVNNGSVQFLVISSGGHCLSKMLSTQQSIQKIIL